MKKSVFQKILTRIHYLFFTIICFAISLTLIVWVIQAVNFLDFVLVRMVIVLKYIFHYTLIELTEELFIARLLPCSFFYFYYSIQIDKI